MIQTRNAKKLYEGKIPNTVGRHAGVSGLVQLGSEGPRGVRYEFWLQPISLLGSAESSHL